jgi:hypothetical protein
MSKLFSPVDFERLDLSSPRTPIIDLTVIPEGPFEQCAQGDDTYPPASPPTSPIPETPPGELLKQDMEDFKKAHAQMRVSWNRVTKNVAALAASHDQSEADNQTALELLEQILVFAEAREDDVYIRKFGDRVLALKARRDARRNLQNSPY